MSVPSNQIAFHYDSIHDALIVEGVLYPKAFFQQLNKMKEPQAAIVAPMETEQGKEMVFTGYFAKIST